MAHKIISTIVFVVLIVIVFYVHNKLTSTAGDTAYITAQVTKGTIITSITGSGQVSASNQIDIKPNVSGNITYVGVQPGDIVKTGKLLFSIDDTSAQKAIRDAEMNLQSAQISLDKLNVQNSTINLSASLAKAYDDGFNSISNTFLDLPGIMSGLNDMFFKSTISNNGQYNVDWYEAQVSSDDVNIVKTYKQNFLDSYTSALNAYNDNYSNYKSVSRTSDNSTIESIISQTYDTVKLVSNAIKNANSYIDFVNNSIQKNNVRTSPAIIATHKASLNNYTSLTNSHLVDLLSIENSIQANKDSFTNSNLDIKSMELSVQQKQNALQDAKDNLAYYYIRAPFDGTIASVPIQKGDNVGSSTTLGTVITTQQMATVSLNEVDIAKVQLGQKTTLTFDAVPDLTISGKVTQIDSIGTVSQGVVDYNVKISFDTYDNRIKPGMTVSAAIITDVKQDVLIVPNSAVKSLGTTKYVLMFSTPLASPATGSQGTPSSIAPNQVTVETGISDDTNTEIISGIKEGDQVVSRTISATNTSKTSTTTTTKSTRSILGGGGPGM